MLNLSALADLPKYIERLEALEKAIKEIADNQALILEILRKLEK